jgi:hypothetical protein
VSDVPALVYLEPDDEITTVVRRVRAAAPGRVVIVAPGRSRATSSAVALRLLARLGADEERAITIVGDALTRSLAAEAGLPAHGSVDDARHARPSEQAAVEPRHAAIHVVRGGASDETAPTMPVAAGVAPTAPGAAAGASAVAEETRPVPTVRSGPRPAPSRPARRRQLGLAAVLAVAAALLVAGIVAGATLLPAATITIVPRTVAVTASYEIVVPDPGRRGGTVEGTATVTATGSYEIVEAARGVVTFRNFNVGPVEVPAGTLVAAGEQAFETTEAVVVPSGSLTSTGTILAGEADAPVVAAAPGPAANVEANAIDTVLDQGVAARLRGFPQNNARLVLNAEPTTGGADTSGVEITELDVEAAVAALRLQLERMVEEARDEETRRIVLEPPAPEPVVELPDDLVGTRDVPETEIGGSLAWEVFTVDPVEVEEEAADRLARDDAALPDGHDLLPEATVVRLDDARLDGDTVIVPVNLSSRAAPTLDREEVLARASGRSAEEARLALAEIGEAGIELWPGWVTAVPDLEWRIEVRIEEVAP